MIRVTGLYRWEDGAHFDHEYYNSEHMRVTKEVLAPHGLIRLESDRFISAKAPASGEIIAATNAYFSTIEVAHAAMTAAGPVLMANVSKYTSLSPHMSLSVVTTHV